jgi:hypothetical protein
LRPFFYSGSLRPFFQMHRTIEFEIEPLPMREGGGKRDRMASIHAPVRPILPANHFCDKFPRAESCRSPQNSPSVQAKLRPIFRANHSAAHFSNRILQLGLMIQQRLCPFCGLLHSDPPNSRDENGPSSLAGPLSDQNQQRNCRFTMLQEISI